MTPDQRVLHEAARWFRNKLRGDSALFDYEQPLFSALARRQIDAPDSYTPREGERENPSPLSVRFPTESLPTTQPPAPDIQHELIRMSRNQDPTGKR